LVINETYVTLSGDFNVGGSVSYVLSKNLLTVNGCLNITGNLTIYLQNVSNSLFANVSCFSNTGNVKIISNGQTCYALQEQKQESTKYVSLFIQDNCNNSIASTGLSWQWIVLIVVLIVVLVMAILLVIICTRPSVRQKVFPFSDKINDFTLASRDSRATVP